MKKLFIPIVFAVLIGVLCISPNAEALKNVFIGSPEIDGILRLLRQFEMEEDVGTQTAKTGFATIWPADDTLYFLDDSTGVVTDLGAGAAGGDPDQNLWETFTSDSGTTTANSTTDTFKIAGGTNTTTSISGDTLTIAVTGGNGDVTAGANLGNNLLIRGDGAGKGIQNSGITVDDSDNVSGVGTIATGVATVTGVINTSVGIDGVGAVDLDYGSADITDHTFTTDGVGTAEIVLPAGAIDSTEILDDTIANADMADNSINSAEYVDGSIDTAHYAAGSVDVTAMGADSVGESELIEAMNFTATGTWNFLDVGTGANGAWDLTIGNTGTYGALEIGNFGLYSSSFSASGMDLDKAILFRQQGNIGVGNDPGIEFCWMEQGNTVRMAIPESGAGNATAMIRSVTIAGPYSQVTGNDIVLGDTWTTFNTNLDFDTGGTGADLFVQDDLEVEGEIYTHGTILMDADDANQLTITTANITSDRTWTFPDDEIALNDLMVGSGAGTFVYTAKSAISLSDFSDDLSHTPEGTAVLSTGEAGGTKFLREDGDNTCSWQAVTAVHDGTITWTGTSTLESGSAFQFGDGTDATLTHTYANTGTDVSVAYSTAAMAVTGALTATNLSGTNTGDQIINTADIADVSVTATEFAELETIGATTISAAQWTGLGGATTAGIALWDDADNVAQLVTLGLTATASEINTPLDGASVTLTEFQELETIGATTISANQWAILGAMPASTRVTMLNGFTMPDSSGDVFMQPHSINAGVNGVWSHGVWLYSNGGARSGLHGSFNIPSDYVDGADVVIVWSTQEITEDVEWDFDYRSVGGNDAESLDNTIQTQVGTNDTAPSVADERMELTIALTDGDIAANDTFQWILFRDTADAGDTIGTDTYVIDVLFEYDK